jgi:hypothetical protein
LLASSLVISLHNPLFPSTRSAIANTNTLGARYLLLCVVVAGVVQDEEIDRWSEASVLIWLVGGDSPLPYISPPMAEDSRTHYTCSSQLVKLQFSSSSTGEALSGVESNLLLEL